MRTYKYTGDDPVDLPSLALVEVTKGTHVHVEDPAIADGLDARDDFEHIPDPERSKAAKKAAAASGKED